VGETGEAVGGTGEAGRDWLEHNRHLKVPPTAPPSTMPTLQAGSLWEASAQLWEGPAQLVANL
jgi:hypothetical protein